jgi:hypothetical protein
LRLFQKCGFSNENIFFIFITKNEIDAIGDGSGSLKLGARNKPPDIKMSPFKCLSLFVMII